VPLKSLHTVISKELGAEQAKLQKQVQLRAAVPSVRQLCNLALLG
jgi:hypothetical protein